MSRTQDILGVAMRYQSLQDKPLDGHNLMGIRVKKRVYARSLCVSIMAMWGASLLTKCFKDHPLDPSRYQIPISFTGIGARDDGQSDDGWVEPKTRPVASLHLHCNPDLACKPCIDVLFDESMPS